VPCISPCPSGAIFEVLLAAWRHYPVSASSFSEFRPVEAVCPRPSSACALAACRGPSPLNFWWQSEILLARPDPSCLRTATWQPLLAGPQARDSSARPSASVPPQQIEAVGHGALSISRNCSRRIRRRWTSQALLVPQNPMVTPPAPWKDLLGVALATLSSSVLWRQSAAGWPLAHSALASSSTSDGRADPCGIIGFDIATLSVRRNLFASAGVLAAPSREHKRTAASRRTTALATPHW